MVSDLDADSYLVANAAALFYDRAQENADDDPWAAVTFDARDQVATVDASAAIMAVFYANVTDCDFEANATDDDTYRHHQHVRLDPMAHCQLRHR